MSKQRITIISAMARNRVIGKDNTIPWYSKDDFRHFKKTTTGHIVVMGRKTFESMGSKPLPNRVNIVVTSQIPGEDRDCIALNDRRSTDETPLIWLTSLETALIWTSRSQWGDREIFIIGGSSIYEQVLKLDKADRMILSLLEVKVEGDTYFPEFDKNHWKMPTVIHHPDSEIPFEIVTYEKIPNTVELLT